MQFAGNIIGLVAMNVISDWKGRRWSYLLSLSLCAAGVLSTIVGSLAYTVPLVILGQFATGLGAGAAFIIPFVLMGDLFNDNLRQTGILSILMGSLGEMSYFVIDKTVDTWQAYMIVCIFIPTVIELAAGRRILVESPVYLSKRSREECLASLNKVAQWNQRPPLVLDDIPILEASQEPQFDFRAVLKREYLPCIILMGVCKLRMGMYYYGIQFAMDSHTMSFGVNMLILGSLELFAYGTLNLVIVRLNRKQSMIAACFTVVAVSIIQRLFVGTKSNLQQILGMALGRCLITYVYGLSNVYINKLFPDDIKSSATRLIESVHKMGSILSPYVVTWSVDAHINPIVVFAIALLCGSSCVCFIYDKDRRNSDEEGYEEMKEMKEMNSVA